MGPSAYQHTVRNFFTVSGIGIHSGAPASLIVRPAFAGTGIVFVRTDVTDRDNVIPAKWSSVVDARLCTVLSNAAGVTVSTVEHLLSACAALGLDNAVIEIDGPETPIMDGSARAFVAALDRAGLRKQAARRRVIRVLKPVTYAEGDKTVTLTPAAAASFSFDLIYDGTLIGRQSFAHDGSEAAYRRDISAARTFGFLHEVEAMQKAGLARGGSLDNAVVIDGDRVMNPSGLRFPDEFVRHKVLDAIGDLYLAGARILGHYHGVKAGHALNNKVLRALFAQPDAWEVAELAEAAPRRAARFHAPAALPAAVTA